MSARLMPGCKVPTCTARSSDGHGFCATHAKVASRKRFKSNLLNAKRFGRLGTGDGFYSTKAWKTLRAFHLKGHPACKLCGLPGDMVDHIHPIQEGGEALNESNLQTLCNKCHARKRGQEGFRASRKRFTIGEL